MKEAQENILIVDDENIIINVLKICLAKDGNVKAPLTAKKRLKSLMRSTIPLLLWILIGLL